jgi:hypothetical protein
MEPVRSFFASAGLGKFDPPHNDHPKTRTIINVLGYIPLISTIVGLFLIAFTLRDAFGEFAAGRKLPLALTTGFLLRGLSQILCVGLIALPFDIICSCVRSVKERQKAQWQTKRAV